ENHAVLVSLPSSGVLLFLFTARKRPIGGAAVFGMPSPAGNAPRPRGSVARTHGFRQECAWHWRIGPAGRGGTGAPSIQSGAPAYPAHFCESPIGGGHLACYYPHSDVIVPRGSWTWVVVPSGIDRESRSNNGREPR